MERAVKVFTVIFTACFLATDFIAKLPSVSGRYECLWWLLAPATGFISLILAMRREAHKEIPRS